MPRMLPPIRPARGGPSHNHGHHRPGTVAGKTVMGRPLGTAARHRKVKKKDTIRGITKPDIRRLARRGGVKRISANIYNDVREALCTRLRDIVQDCVAYVDYRRGKTVTVTDVIFSLKRIGRPIYGFDPETYDPEKRKRPLPGM